MKKKIKKKKKTIVQSILAGIGVVLLFLFEVIIEVLLELANIRIWGIVVLLSFLVLFLGVGFFLSYKKRKRNKPTLPAKDYEINEKDYAIDFNTFDLKEDEKG